MKEIEPIESFVSRVRTRINRHRAMNTGLWSLAVGQGVLVVIALSYILRGHSVPSYWYIATVISVAVAALVFSLVRRLSHDDAAHFADGFYELEDSVISAREFAKSDQRDGFRKLDISKTERALQELEPGKIRYRYPRRLSFACLLLLVLCTLSAFNKPSLAVQQKLALEEQTLQLTEEFSEKILEELEALEEGIDDPEEKELLQANELRKWVDELEETKDQEEAMRQMANLEKKITRMANRLAQKNMEQLLAKMAKELNQEQAHKELAKKLKQQKYKEAGQDLKQLEPKAKELSERKKELAKLKSAAQRMAAAARAAKARAKGKNGGGDGGSGEEMASLMESIDSDVGDLEGELDDLERASKKGKLTDADLSNAEMMSASISEKLGEFDGKLSRLAAAKSLQKKLLAMSKTLGQCQGCLAGQSGSPFAAPGGKKPGVGTVESRRQEQDALVDNGQNAQLKGIKGQGPSLTRVETAQDGTGVSHRRAEAKQREFKRQYESFVSREDVPEDVRAAVRNYFTTIHEGESVATGGSE